MKMHLIGSTRSGSTLRATALSLARMLLLVGTALAVAGGAIADETVTSGTAPPVTTTGVQAPAVTPTSPYRVTCADQQIRLECHGVPCFDALILFGFSRASVKAIVVPADTSETVQADGRPNTVVTFTVPERATVSKTEFALFNFAATIAESATEMSVEWKKSSYQEISESIISRDTLVAYQEKKTGKCAYGFATCFEVLPVVTVPKDAVTPAQKPPSPKTKPTEPQPKNKP